MILFELVPFLLLICGYLSLRFSSFPVARKLVWLPGLMLVLLVAMMWIDSSCDGDGFKLSWIDCRYEFLSDYAQQFSMILWLNVFCIFLFIPLWILIQGVFELARWISRMKSP